MPPTSPGPGGTWSMWSTPTPRTGSSNGSWTARNAPPTYDSYLSIAPDGAGGVRVKGRGSAEDGALLKAALMPLTAPAPAVDEHEHGDLVHDPRDAGARMWDALVADRPARPGHRPATRLPRRTRPAHGHHHPRRTASGPDRAGRRRRQRPLRRRPIRRLACDAEIIPAVLGSQGEPLDVGRAKRLVTLAIWAALVIRDRHCAFPGCDRPPLMCHAHHILHWISGGETKLSNLVLLCGHHHRVIHHSPWQVRINSDDLQTRIPATTQTRRRKALDPISATTRMMPHVACWVRVYGGAGPTGRSRIPRA